MKHLKIVLLTAALAAGAAFAQEALKSVEEEYYDFLALCGIVERPTLNYRTLSDSKWQIPEGTEHPWQGNNLGAKRVLHQSENGAPDNFFTRGIEQSVALKIYGPEWYNSFNTEYADGWYDGALWQGRGYNTSLTGGARLEAYGFEVTFKPQVSFSQNLDFDIMDSEYGDGYGYFWGTVDAPQRFGDEAFWTFDWGDTEIRYTWHNLTAGFGTQAIWLGPARVNPVLLSNNAATFPKVDFGLRKTSVYVPHFGWHLGQIEARVFTGRLTESDYFDDDDSNDHNMIHGLSLSYAPSFIPGLTLGANRICLVKWDWENLKYVVPQSENTYVGDDTGKGEDQKMSITVDLFFPQVGFEVYGELGIDDYTGSVIYMGHTYVYTVGARKAIRISKKHNLHGELIFEWNNTEMSQDYQFYSAYSFGMHYQITQGYTNRGQWLGSGIGYGGVSRYWGFKLYHSKGNIMLFIQHTNYDNNYIYSKAIKTDKDHTDDDVWYKGSKILGGSATFFIKNLVTTAGFMWDEIRNPLYQTDEEKTTWNRNWLLFCTLKYNF